MRRGRSSFAAAASRGVDLLFWPGLFVVAVTLPFVYTSDYFVSIAVIFALYASINLMWSLVLGVAGLLSFATLAIVGSAAYAAAKAGGGTQSFTLGRHAWPVWAMMVLAVAIGIIAGFVVAIPSIRLRGVYFALFTFGLVQLCNAFVLNSTLFGYASGLSNTNRFVPASELGTEHARLVHYFLAMALLVLMLGVYVVVDRSRLGLLLRVARDSEPVAQALGIDIARVRLLVFLISSAGLGLVGGFYVGIYGAVSPAIFSFDTLLLLFAMIVVGGLGSARGVILGVLAVLFVEQRFVEYGSIRFVAIGCLMLAVVLFADRGLVGIPEQIREARTRFVRGNPA